VKQVKKNNGNNDKVNNGFSRFRLTFYFKVISQVLALTTRIRISWGHDQLKSCKNRQDLIKKKPRLVGALMLAEWTGLEPATPGVTGRYSNQLNYHSFIGLLLKPQAVKSGSFTNLEFVLHVFNFTFLLLNIFTGKCSCYTYALVGAKRLELLTYAL
jgi:hypothetical protein